MQPVQLKRYAIELWEAGQPQGRLLTCGELSPFLADGFEMVPYLGSDKLEAACIMERYIKVFSFPGDAQVVPVEVTVCPREE